MKSKSGQRTLLASVLMSAPGPLVVGVALLYGQSSTQLADFIRRSVELIAIIVSMIVYRLVHKDRAIQRERQYRLEKIAYLTVGFAMVLSGLTMIFIAFLTTGEEQGTVIPGLIIALLGLIANTIFYVRYRKLNRMDPNGIMVTQYKLYFAKTLIDGCVTIALLSVFIFPGTRISYCMDLWGSIVVAGYLIINGLIMVLGEKKLKAFIDFKM